MNEQLPKRQRRVVQYERTAHPALLAALRRDVCRSNFSPTQMSLTEEKLLPLLPGCLNDEDALRVLFAGQIHLQIAGAFAVDFS